MAGLNHMILATYHRKIWSDLYRYTLMCAAVGIGKKEGIFSPVSIISLDKFGEDLSPWAQKYFSIPSLMEATWLFLIFRVSGCLTSQRSLIPHIFFIVTFFHLLSNALTKQLGNFLFRITTLIYIFSIISLSSKSINHQLLNK